MGTTAIEPIIFITCIVNRGEGRQVTELCTREGIFCNLLLHGRGTADSATLAMLGLGEAEKDIVILTVAQSRQDYIVKKITSALKLDEPGNGIAFSIRFSSVASQLDSYAALAGALSVAERENERE